MVPASARKAIFTAAHALRTSNVKKILFPAHCYPTCPRSVERKKVNIYEIKTYFVVVEIMLYLISITAPINKDYQLYVRVQKAEARNLKQEGETCGSSRREVCGVCENGLQCDAPMDTCGHCITKKGNVLLSYIYLFFN